MSADTTRKAYKYTCSMVRPQMYSEKSLMESVVDFFSDVVPQAYSGYQKSEDREKIQWMLRRTRTCFAQTRKDCLSCSYWVTVTGSRYGTSLLMEKHRRSCLSDKVRSVSAVFFPTRTQYLVKMDTRAKDRLLAGQPYCGVKFVSLKTGDEVHSISFKTLPVQNIECNKRFIVMVFLEKLCVHEACNFKQLFWITMALSTRWLAYADKRLVAMHQSCGGMSGDGSQSYAATVIRSIQRFVDVWGGHCKLRYGQQAKPSKTGLHAFNVNEDNEGGGLIAHFHAHANEPVSHMAFDPTGTLLVTACKLGHNFHVFRLMAHPVSSALGAVIDISLSQDSRWVTVSSHRGTTHLFPITTYGGPVNVRTHSQPHVVNRASRFHKSAGLDDIDHTHLDRRSPVLSTSPSHSGQYDRYPSLIQQNTLNNNMGNPRLPPYPHPITIPPAYQVKQPLNVVLNPANKNQSPSHSPTGQDNVYKGGKRPVDSLYVMAQSGTLVEYVLEPRARAPSDKITDDCMLVLNVAGRVQLKNSPELRPPLPSNSPLILAHEAVVSQIPTAPDLYDLPGLTRHDSRDSLSSDHSNADSDDQWLSQTYQENTTVLSSQSSALLSQSPELQPTRSNPVSMPNARPAYRRLSASDSSPSQGQGVVHQGGPLMIEAGSFEQSPHLLDVYSNWTESTVVKQPQGSNDLEEDRLKEIADAMVESPAKDMEKLSLRQHDMFGSSNENLSTSSGSSSGALPRHQDPLLPEQIFSMGGESLDSS
ncbi:BCAS3-like protein [Mya arenaria]|uniref:BCAS3-like protein n=1 Tax=Mya arenaria TaxID=6604 RepID=A0ABY7DY37_MYAAR|nr:BCAS3-like protein [Mya arenaria]